MRLKITKNQFKAIAAVSMLLDHIGVGIFPEYSIFRILGRIAFPAFAYALYEGSHYTSNKIKYFCRVFILGILCMLVYYIYTHEIYGNVLITFSMSLLILYGIRYLKENMRQSICKCLTGMIFVSVVLLFAFVICSAVYIDYGFAGVLLPCFAEIFHGKQYNSELLSIVGFSAGILLLAVNYGGVQYYSLLTIPLLFLVDHNRYEKNSYKYFFYVFYPLHLVLIEGISHLSEYL